MEDGIGVNSPEFLQKKIERLKTALDEANVLMDRQVTERDDARAQLDGVKRENQDLKRQLEELRAQGGGAATVADTPAEPFAAAEPFAPAEPAAPVEPAVPAVDPAVEWSLRDRIAQLETERESLQSGGPEAEQD